MVVTGKKTLGSIHGANALSYPPPLFHPNVGVGVCARDGCVGVLGVKGRRKVVFSVKKVGVPLTHKCAPTGLRRPSGGRRENLIRVRGSPNYFQMKASDS